MPPRWADRREDFARYFPARHRQPCPIRYRISRHTRGLLRLYHQRGLLETPIARRDVRDVPIELSPSERALYDAVEDYISTSYMNASPDKQVAVGFVMTSTSASWRAVSMPSARRSTGTWRKSQAVSQGS
jgi:hypothetical protein